MMVELVNNSKAGSTNIDTMQNRDRKNVGLAKYVQSHPSHDFDTDNRSIYTRDGIQKCRPEKEGRREVGMPVRRTLTGINEPMNWEITPGRCMTSL